MIHVLVIFWTWARCCVSWWWYLSCTESHHRCEPAPEAVRMCWQRFPNECACARCRKLHYIHHKYNKEHSLSPFAGLAFHPLDGILQVPHHSGARELTQRLAVGPSGCCPRLEPGAETSG